MYEPAATDWMNLEYGTKMQEQPEVILQHWSFTVVDGLANMMVVPDGCRDLIIQMQPNGRRQYMISDLDTQAYQIDTTAGMQFIGYRFQPAAIVDTEKLLHATISMSYLDPASVLTAVADCVQMNWRLHEALKSLSEKQTVALASRSLGVSERTVERLVKASTGYPPAFWKALARLRKTAKAIVSTNTIPLDEKVSLVEIAIQNGYADQAHMNREFKRWFGVSPRLFGSQVQWREALLLGYN